MKRTGFINLERMRKQLVRPALKPLVAAMAGFTLSACSDSEEVHIFSTLEECKLELPEQIEACETAYQSALQEWETSAPRYASRSDCEYDFGHDRCLARPIGSNWFVPAMTGFMVGRMLPREEEDDGDYYSRSRSRSIYKSSSYSSPVRNKWVTADGQVIADGSQRITDVDKSIFKPKPSSARTFSRGGFGATAIAKSGGGSSSGSWGG